MKHDEAGLRFLSGGRNSIGSTASWSSPASQQTPLRPSPLTALSAQSRADAAAASSMQLARRTLFPSLSAVRAAPCKDPRNTERFSRIWFKPSKVCTVFLRAQWVAGCKFVHATAIVVALRAQRALGARSVQSDAPSGKRRTWLKSCSVRQSPNRPPRLPSGSSKSASKSTAASMHCRRRGPHAALSPSHST